MRLTANAPQIMGASNTASPMQIAEAGYTLAVNVDDPWSDLRGKPEAEYS